jgi:hypothetical protein
MAAGWAVPIPVLDIRVSDECGCQTLTALHGTRDVERCLSMIGTRKCSGHERGMN